MADPAPQPPPSPAVWTFRGYELDANNFTAALVQLYRAEIERSNTWRTRLDATTNSAILVAAGAILFTLALPEQPILALVLGTLLVTLCLWVETRRYRYYELWSYRVRLMETDFFAAMLVPPFKPSEDWSESLAHTLLQPEFPVTVWEALGRRFRRNYLWIYLLLGATWAAKSYLYPFPATTLTEFIMRSDLGLIPGWVLIVIGVLFNATLFAIGFLTAGLTASSGEVLPKYLDIPIISEVFSGGPRPATASAPTDSATKTEATPTSAESASNRPSRPRPQVLALIITPKPEPVSAKIMKDLRRGVTALSGMGMYTHQERKVLMIALTITEIPHLKAVVREEDPNAFIVVTPAREIFGRGFKPLADV